MYERGNIMSDLQEKTTHVCRNRVSYYIGQLWGKMKNKKDSVEIFFLIANFAATAIIAFWGFGISNNSNKLSEVQIKLTELQIYPFFNVGMITEQNGDSVKDYLRKILVTNLGGNYYNLDCTTASYFLVHDKEAEYYIPIHSLFAFGSGFALSNESKLVFTRISETFFRLKEITNTDFSEPNSDFLHKTYISGIVVFLKLHYQNCDGEYKTQYFDAAEGALLENEEGEHYFEYFTFHGAKSNFDVANQFDDLDNNESIINKLKRIISLPKETKTRLKIYPYK